MKEKNVLKKKKFLFKLRNYFSIIVNIKKQHQ